MQLNNEFPYFVIWISQRWFCSVTKLLIDISLNSILRTRSCQSAQGARSPEWNHINPEDRTDSDSIRRTLPSQRLSSCPYIGDQHVMNVMSTSRAYASVSRRYSLTPDRVSSVKRSRSPLPRQHSFWWKSIRHQDDRVLHARKRIAQSSPSDLDRSRLRSPPLRTTDKGIDARQTLTRHHFSSIVRPVDLRQIFHGGLISRQLFSSSYPFVTRARLERSCRNVVDSSRSAVLNESPRSCLLSGSRALLFVSGSHSDCRSRPPHDKSGVQRYDVCQYVIPADVMFNQKWTKLTISGKVSVLYLFSWRCLWKGNMRCAKNLGE